MYIYILKGLTADAADPDLVAFEHAFVPDCAVDADEKDSCMNLLVLGRSLGVPGGPWGVPGRSSGVPGAPG